MSLIRLDPFIYLMTTLGEAEAHFLRSDGVEVAAVWGVFQCETKENWWWANHHVRLMESISAARDACYSAIELDGEMKQTLAPHALRHKRSMLYDWAMQYSRDTVSDVRKV